MHYFIFYQSVSKYAFRREISMFLNVQDDDGVVVNRLEKVFWSRI